MVYKAQAPGKLIISGEHAVVYGYPALAAAVNLKTSAELTPRNDGKQVLKSNIGKIELLRLAVDKTLEVVEKTPSAGFNLTTKSNLPVGSGVGSSASVSAACATALLKFLAIAPDRELVNKIVYETEKEVHGTPSGIDNTTVVYGGFIKFQKKNDKFLFNQMKSIKKMPQFLLINTGVPKETTREMVLMVKERMEKDARIKKILGDIGKVAQEFINDFERGKFNPDRIKQNQRLLEQTGVVGDRTKSIVHSVEEAGGYAKICGAGGIKAGSGILLAYHPRIDNLVKLAVEENLEYFSAKLGVEGV